MAYSLTAKVAGRVEVMLRQASRRWRRPARFGRLRRTTPVSRLYGFDRGLPIDRHYIESFLSARAGDIRGRVLDIGDDAYTRRYGADRVEAVDVLSVTAGNPLATIVADLTRADEIASDRYDCVLLIQTLQFIYDVKAALETVHRILKPGGVALATFSGISAICHEDPESWSSHWCWHFTSLSARRLFEETFGPGSVEIEQHGSALTAVAFLHGLAAEELTREELESRHPDYEVLLAARAIKR
jgi:SAM-dependent methyltransferase